MWYINYNYKQICTSFIKDASQTEFWISSFYCNGIITLERQKQNPCSDDKHINYTMLAYKHDNDCTLTIINNCECG